MQLDGTESVAPRPERTRPGPVAADLFAGTTEMHARARALDWARTPLGPPAAWSPALRAVVRACLESPFAICLWCGPEHVLLYNDAYRRVLGAKHPTALGRPGREVWAEISDRLAPMLATVQAGGPPVYADDAPFVMQRAADRPGEGELAWFTFALSAVRDDSGAVVALLNVVSETTARVLAEREALAAHADAQRAGLDAEAARMRLAEVFRQAPAFIAVVRGADYVFELANDAYFQLVGHRAVLGKSVLEALPEVRGQGFIELLDHVLATGTPFVGHELPIQLARAPGAPPEERFVNFVYQPLTDRDGTRTAVFVHGMDVTEQVRARAEVERLLGESERARQTVADAHAKLEAQARELQGTAAQLAARTQEAEVARNAAEAASRLKSEFLATMSHEFRTPLNAILGYAQLLDMGILGPATAAQHAHLERLQASARHLLQLVDDVLDVAKVDADRLEVRRDPHVTGAAIAAAVALIQPQATAKGVRLMDLGADAPGVPYVGDEHRVRQILVNLLSNAVKFTPPGGQVTVTCGAAAEPDPGVQIEGLALDAAGTPGGASPQHAWAFIRVADTGVGIEPDLLDRLFEPFVQGNAALTREQGGTGLGLAISRRLARLMGGDLTVRSQPGHGAAFTLWLPTSSEGVEQPPRLAAAVGAQRRTPAGVEVMAEADVGGALDDAAFAVLHALGVRLAGDAETIAQRYVAALRADDRFPGARELPAVQLRDHATPFLGLLASQLMVLGETRGRAPELLRDGGQVQRLMAELHGAQRHRLGWTEADIERETAILLAEVERAIQGAIDTSATSAVEARAAGGAGGPGDTDGAEISGAAVRVAAQYATDVARHVLEQEAQRSLRAYRFATAADAP